jgi:hypothetical protein
MNWRKYVNRAKRMDKIKSNLTAKVFALPLARQSVFAFPFSLQFL